MSRPTLHLRNYVEDRTVNDLSARLVKEREGAAPKVRRDPAPPRAIRWNGQLYVPANDRSAGDKLFPGLAEKIGGGE